MTDRLINSNKGAISTTPLTDNATLFNDQIRVLAILWTYINQEVPEYYKPVLADNGEYLAVVARVSDGDEDFYSICGTDCYMNPDPVKWYRIEFK